MGPKAMFIKGDARKGLLSDRQEKLRARTGMGGMTGNRLFFDRILILDAPGGRYTVIEPK